MTKINIQPPSEFAGKIFIMVVLGNVFGNVLSSMGQSLSTTKKIKQVFIYIFWGTAYLQIAIVNKTSHYKRLLVFQEVQFKFFTI